MAKVMLFRMFILPGPPDGLLIFHVGKVGVILFVASYFSSEP